MADVNKRFFDSLLRDSKMSLRNLAQRMEMSHSQLSLTFSGDRRMQLQEAVQISSIFGVPLGSVIEAMGIEDMLGRDHRVPVIGYMDSDWVVHEFSGDDIYRTTAPAGVPADGEAVQCRTSGSKWEFLDGAVHFFKRRPRAVEQSIIGRLAMVKIKSGPVVTAGVKRGYKDNSYTLQGPHEAQDVLLDWGTPVIFTRH